MQTPIRFAVALVVGLAALAPCALALPQAPQTFTPKAIVQWGQGGERERAMLTQMGVGDLAQGQFGLAAADLNADGRPEIIVLSMSACDNAGCPVTAIQNAGQGRVNRIFAQKLSGRLAITNEVVGGFNAFAAADPAGAIMKDSAGRTLVYPVGAGAQATAPPAQAAAPAPRPITQPPSAPAARAPAAAPTPAPAAASAVAPPPIAQPRPNLPPARLALLTGEGKPDWRTPGAEYLPVCMWPICLNPKVTEKTGVGTDKATVRGDVTAEDAARWCQTYKERDRLCPEVEVANNGSRGGTYGDRFDAKAEANCSGGKLRAIDGREYTYLGTWPDGGPGAGRARFSGEGTGPGQGWRFFEQEGLRQMNTGASTFRSIANESGAGEALAIQWEMLCKGAPPPAVQ